MERQRARPTSLVRGLINIVKWLVRRWQRTDACSECLFIHFSITLKEAVVFFFWIPNSNIYIKKNHFTAPKVFALFFFLLFTFVTSRNITFLQRSLKKSSEMQQYADIYLLLNYSTCFGRPSRPSSGVHKPVAAASDTNHTIWGASWLPKQFVPANQECGSSYWKLRSVCSTQALRMLCP